MSTLISNIDKINLVEETWNRYVQALDEYQVWVDEHPYEIQLMDTIDQLIERKVNGDLKDDDNVPDKAEIEGFLSDQFDVYKKWRDSFKNDIEEYADSFVKELENQEFLEQFYSSIHSPLNRLQRKYKYFQVLFRSKVGIDYLKSCALYEPDSTTQAPIFSFPELERDLNLIEQAQAVGDSKFVDLSVLFLSLFSELIPEYTKIWEVETKRVYYLSYLVVRIYYERIGVSSYDSYQSFNMIEFEQSILQVDIEQTTISRYVLNKVPLIIKTVHTVLLVIQLAAKVHKIKNTPNLENSIEILSGIIGIAEMIPKFRPPQGVENIIKASLSTSSRALNLAASANTFILSPILFCYQLNNFTNATLNGNDRASFVALMSSISAISGPVAILLGLSGPVGIVLAIGILAVGVFGAFLFDTDREKNLKRWLNNNYFGKHDLDDEDYSINFKNPVNVGFEWDRSEEGSLLVKQIRSIFSLLHPLNSKNEKIVEVSDRFYHLTFKLDNPNIPPNDFYLRLRFFNGGRDLGDEVSNADINGLAQRKGERWYLIPIALDEPDYFLSDWKNDPKNEWFVNHNVEWLHQTSNPLKTNRIVSYELTMLLKKDRPSTHKYYQIQVIPAGQKLSDENYRSQRDIEEVLEKNPFIITESKSVDY